MRSQTQGGGVYIGKYAHCGVVGGRIAGNVARRRGAVVCGGGGVYSSALGTLSLRGVALTDNRAVLQGDGCVSAAIKSDCSGTVDHTNGSVGYSGGPSCGSACLAVVVRAVLCCS